MKKKLIILTLLFIAGLFLLGTHGKSNINAIALTVNTYPITYEELSLHLKKDSSVIESLYSQKIDTPQKELLNIAIKQAVQDKIIQILALESGMIENISYDKFLQKLDTENKQRQQALNAGKAIYGPPSFAAPQYYATLMSDLKVLLKKDIITQTPSDSPRLITYYNENKDIRYKNIDSTSATLTILTSPSFTTEIVLDHQNARSLSEANQLLYDHLLMIQPGETLEWTDDSGIINQLYCKSKEAGEYFTLEEHFDAIINDYAYETLNKLIEDRVTKAQINILLNEPK